MTAIGIIGNGAISGHLQKRLKAAGAPVKLIVRRDTYVYDGRANERDNMSLAAIIGKHSDLMKLSAIFLAIPTLDDGSIAAQYIDDAAVQNHIPVITCEKGSLAYHASRLPFDSGLLHYSAAVGGGTHILPYMRLRNLSRRTVDIDGVLNGTINFILDSVSNSNKTFGEACADARRLGFAEPSDNGDLTLVNGELRDVCMKACAVYNTVLTAEGYYLTPTLFEKIVLTSSNLEEIAQHAPNMRLIVSFSNRIGARLPILVSHIPSAKTVIGGWTMQIGFCSLSANPHLKSWIPGGVNNAVRIVEGGILGNGGIYDLCGPGAGLDATTGAMLNDLEPLLQYR